MCFSFSFVFIIWISFSEHPSSGPRVPDRPPGQGLPEAARRHRRVHAQVHDEAPGQGVEAALHGGPDPQAEGHGGGKAGSGRYAINLYLRIYDVFTTVFLRWLGPNDGIQQPEFERRLEEARQPLSVFVAGHHSGSVVWRTARQQQPKSASGAVAAESAGGQPGGAGAVDHDVVEGVDGGGSRRRPDGGGIK